ncbi:MAG: zinc-ribbon domain-containing protein [Roseicyclus sp.]|uniref:zinc-ribbon domain-containing protein n=1 Tax=Roseicyclus sp. TaxID=1914329 RepID=UPI003A83C82E
MRLTCPNCSARYEVADSMIPPEGRDVQCSNCSTTWFQPGRRVEPPPVASGEGAKAATVQPRRPPGAAAPPPAPPPAPSADAAAPQAPAGGPEPEGTAEAAPERAPEAEVAPGIEAGANAPRRRSLDPELRSILEAEAEREARLRRAEADPVETQSEMSLEEGPEDALRAKQRAELDAAPDAFDMSPAVAGASAPVSARDLFPDIEEINSTLRDTGDRSRHDADASDVDTLDTLPRRRRGTRIGFLLVLAIAAGGVAAYVNADSVVATLPQLAPAMEAYVAAVDGARFWLDDLARGLAAEGPGG